MAQNPGRDPELRQEIFGGLVSNVDPTALPNGVSPDCPDMSFLPGSVFSRPCFKKLYATPLGAVTITYFKSYVDNKKTIRNLTLDSAGNLWMENVTIGALPTVIATTTPGSYAKSVTAFGREYIAFNDKLHGSDIPLQYDGTNLDRVTQDGPGVSPAVSNLIIPATAIAGAGAPLSLTIVEVDPENEDPDSGFFVSINVYTSSALTDVEVGQTVQITGASGTTHGSITPFVAAWGPITAIYAGSPNSLIQIAAYIPAGTDFWTGTGTMAIAQGALQRQSNVVTGTTTTAHQLQPGYQVQITNALAQTVGNGISSIVINNSNLAGIATVTMGLASGTSRLGLVPGLKVNITGVKPVTIGTSISTIKRVGQVVTVVMSAGTGLSPRAVITTSGVTNTSFNTTAQVATVTTTTNTGDTFTFLQVDVDAADTGGSVTLNWPIPETATPSLFEVVAVPSDTSFQVAVNYADGSWTTGAVSLAWNGTFFVQSVPDSTTFTYLQNGPDGTASAVSGSIAVTPYGQATPGQHQMQVFFIDRQGGLTKPSPPVSFVANGGQYIRVTDIPIGPSNIVARAVAFTGAFGAYFFYIGAPPQVNGQLVGTSTVINDNTTTFAVFDFGDPTLFGTRDTGGAISVQGNNLANQIVLDGALGFGFYGSRLITYGQRNTIQNLLNLGFDGGYIAPVAPATARYPTGWTRGDSSGQLDTGHYSDAWKVTATGLGGNLGVISQSMYEDASGAPIALANTRYKARVWLKPSSASASLTFTVKISSASASFTSTAAISGTLMSTSGSWLEVDFSTAMPNSIPSDLTLSLYAASTGATITLLVDELGIIYADTPYLNSLFASYVNNATGIDGVTGEFGPSEDTHQPLDLFVLRGSLHILTQDPQGRLHQTLQGLSEPSSWVVTELAANCGTVSAFAATVSQADDATETGGKQWAAWYSFSGFLIFGGEQPDKISQEIQRPPRTSFVGSPQDLSDINTSALLTVWALNDPQQQIIYLGVPLGTATAPNRVFMLNYLGLDSAAAIAAADPVHKTITGAFKASEVTRKWSPWNATMNGAALIYQQSPSGLVPVFLGGNGSQSGALSALVDTIDLPGSQGLITWISGSTFESLQFGSAVTINGSPCTVISVISPTDMTISGTPGTHTQVRLTSSAPSSFGNAYTLDATRYTDDDYGQVSPYYVTHSFPDSESAQAFQLGAGMLMVGYFRSYFSGVGNMVMSLDYGYLGNSWPLNSGNYLMSQTPLWNAPWDGGQCTGFRFFARLTPSPDPDGNTASPVTDVAFSVSDLVLSLRRNDRMPDRGVWP